MISDILMIISIVCVLASLIPACISDFKTRLIDTKTWSYAAYIGIPCGLVAFILKLLNEEIVMPSLILTLATVMVVIIITVILANIRDPWYNPSNCSKCNYKFTSKKDLGSCPNCKKVNGKSILGGADMIAIDIILITSFYLSQQFIPIFILSFVVSSMAAIICIVICVSESRNYRIPLIIPITLGYIITLICIFGSIDVLSFIKL
jgi:hypothetical protein